MPTELHAIASVQDAITTQWARGNVRKLAGTVGLALNVQPGKALVMVLGTGSERNNQEALEHWVMQTLIERDLLPTREVIPLLTELLEDTLARWQEEGA